jgi:hypothetical protein
MPQIRVCKFTLLCAVSALTLAASGCVRPLSELDQHTHAFSSAAILVTNSSEDAYSSANRLHSQEQTARAVIDYNKSTSWDPDKYLTPLLKEDQLEARREVLEGLRSYASTLADLTSPKGNTDLDTAAKNVGTNLQALSGTVNTAFGTGDGSSITDDQKNLLSTALRALGDTLRQRIVSKQLPAVIQANDKTVADICTVLLADLKILKRQSSKDYGDIQLAQDQYIRTATPPLTAEQRRIEITRLLDLVRKQQQNDVLLSKLEKSIADLQTTHHALADAARGNSPVSLQQYIAQLTAEGQSLATYYQSLSSS